MDFIRLFCFNADSLAVRDWHRKNLKGAQNGSMVAQISLEDRPLACGSVEVWTSVG